MFATPLTFANCVYTARKNVGYKQAVEGLKSLKSYEVFLNTYFGN